MYYLFETESILWKDEYLYAFLKKNIPYDEVSWFSEPRLPLVNFDFKFFVNEKALFPDNYKVSPIIYLCSNKLINILKQFSIFFESYPVEIFSTGTGKFIRDDYQVIRLFKITDCLDLKSTIFKGVEIGGNNLQLIQKPVYKKEFLKSGIFITRIKSFERYIVIREEVRIALENAGITGVKFLAAENYEYF